MKIVTPQTELIDQVFRWWTSLPLSCQAPLRAYTYSLMNDCLALELGLGSPRRTYLEEEVAKLPVYTDSKTPSMPLSVPKRNVSTSYGEDT